MIVFAVLKKILNQELWNITIKRTGEHRTDEYSKALLLMEKIGQDKVIKIITGQLD